ncbi:hypothetical protein HYT56_02465 [Candidatus Woesearchaeota archaeon]|nr:hypothetical protein [Candidatus Woesearchaeota archaeon]
MINYFLNKRGISPLIASVLLIAFTVTLFIIISNFVRKDVVDTSLEKGGEQIGKAFDCLSAEVDIVDVSKKSDDFQVKYSIDNVGDVTLENIVVRIVGSTGVVKFEDCGQKASLERCTTATPKDVAVGVVNSIEAIPQVESGLCGANVVSKDITATYS